VSCTHANDSAPNSQPDRDRCGQARRPLHRRLALLRPPRPRHGQPARQLPRRLIVTPQPAAPAPGAATGTVDGPPRRDGELRCPVTRTHEPLGGVTADSSVPGPSLTAAACLRAAPGHRWDPRPWWQSTCFEDRGPEQHLPLPSGSPSRTRPGPRNTKASAPGQFGPDLNLTGWSGRPDSNWGPLAPKASAFDFCRSHRPSRIGLVHLLRHPCPWPALASRVRRGSRSNTALPHRPASGSYRGGWWCPRGGGGGGGIESIPGGSSGHTSSTAHGAWSTTNRVAGPRLCGPRRE